MWRALVRELNHLGHTIVFFERDASGALEGAELIPYHQWREVQAKAAGQLADSDAAIITSAFQDVGYASQAVLESPARVRCFYDLNPAVTLGLQKPGTALHAVPAEGLSGFDVVLSYTGGRALAELKSQLGARHVVPLYGCVDPQVCQAVAPDESYRSDLSYLGEWLPEIRATLDSLFLEPARRRPDLRFIATSPGGPGKLDAPANVQFLAQVPEIDISSVYRVSRLTLTLAPSAAADMGYCPTSSMFEAAACGIPVLSDDWDGLDYFFEPEREILVARTTGHVMDALALAKDRLAQIGRAGRDRVLATHTAARRALELENILEAAISLPVEPTGAGRK